MVNHISCTNADVCKLGSFVLLKINSTQHVSCTNADVCKLGSFAFLDTLTIVQIREIALPLPGYDIQTVTLTTLVGGTIRRLLPTRPRGIRRRSVREWPTPQHHRSCIGGELNAKMISK